MSFLSFCHLETNYVKSSKYILRQPKDRTLHFLPSNFFFLNRFTNSYLQKQKSAVYEVCPFPGKSLIYNKRHSVCFGFLLLQISRVILVSVISKMNTSEHSNFISFNYFLFTIWF